jgi:hypothetical protein
MSRRTAASTTTLQVRFFAPLAWIGTRAKLVSGEMSVSGNQWPLLVYADLQYDPDDPWSGLFRNQILVWVDIL